MNRIIKMPRLHRGRMLLVLAFLLLVPVLLIPAEAAANEPVVVVFSIGSSTYTVNGVPQTMDVSPAIIEGRTLLPIRFVATPLNADVGWDGTARKATVSLGTDLMELWIGQSDALVNGKTVPIDADNPNIKPLIINGRTMLPLRFVTENLGCGVQWDPVTRNVTITSGDSSGETGEIPEVGKDLGKIPDINLPVDIGKDLIKIPDPAEEPNKQIPDVSKLPHFKDPDKISAPDYEVLYINDTAYYKDYFGTVLTADTGMLTTPDDTYKWGVTNTKDMSLQYFTFFLKPDGKYEKFRASFFLDSSAKADLVMNIRKETKDGMVLKSLTLKPGETLKNVTVDISGVNMLCIESEMRINHGTVKKIVVGEPIFYNSKL
ncbi:MAG: copper amine oxidase N-terminal domain-containing protein [Syntrophomonadaceae bacterium]|nr:copper amine oxidase N-terminal domain-containing protein [Syntrophomonadaceae bacterium]